MRLPLYVIELQIKLEEMKSNYNGDYNSFVMISGLTKNINYHIKRYEQEYKQNPIKYNHEIMQEIKDNYEGYDFDI